MIGFSGSFMKVLLKLEMDCTELLYIVMMETLIS